MSDSRKRAGMLALALAAVALLGTSSADAATFCVSNPGCEAAGGTSEPTIQAAITASNAATDQDRIEIGAGTFPGPTSSTFRPVDIVGAGTQATTIAGVAGSTNTLQVGGTGPSSVSALRLDMDNNDIRGLYLIPSFGQAASATNIFVTGAAAPVGAIGAELENGGTLSDSTVQMPTAAASTSTAVSVGIGGVSRSHLEGATGLAGYASHARVSIVASTIGVLAVGAMTLDQVTVRMVGAGVAIKAASTPGDLVHGSLTARHLTALGSGSGTGAAAVSACGPGGNDPVAAKLVLRNTILRGFATDRARSGTSCPNGPSPATIETAYSIFDPAKTTDTGAGGFTENGAAVGANSLGATSLNVDPLFVNDLDFHLTSASPAIDKGDPADPAAGESTVDLDGNPRVADGNCDGVSRRDMGAFELPSPDADADGFPDCHDSCPAVVGVAPDGCPPDTTAPGISLGGKKKQPEDGTIEVLVSCDTDCTATAGGTVTVKAGHGGGKTAAKPPAKQFALDPVTAPLSAGSQTTMKLALSKKASRVAKRSLKHRGKVSATVEVTASDAAANASEAQERVRLVAKHHRHHAR
jgi:hypothetical protein